MNRAKQTYEDLDDTAMQDYRGDYDSDKEMNYQQADKNYKHADDFTKLKNAGQQMPDTHKEN